MGNNQPVKLDVDGAERLTKPYLALLNQYPDLLPGERIVFGDGTQTKGIALYPISGAIIVTEQEDILGNYDAECQYPAYLIYKIGGDSGESRINIKDFLDDLGRWAEEHYKDIIADVEVTQIQRQSPAYLESREENGVENWALYLTLFYKIHKEG